MCAHTQIHQVEVRKEKTNWIAKDFYADRLSEMQCNLLKDCTAEILQHSPFQIRMKIQEFSNEYKSQLFRSDSA